jgi:hypothetical protein
MDFFTALDIVRCKPDTEPCVLQTLMQSLAEWLIDTAVANETGVELYGLIEEGGQIVNQRVW